MPIPDRDAAGALGAALRRLDYTERRLHDLLGDEAYSSEPADVAVHDRRLPPTRLGDVARLLLLSLPVPLEALERALGERGVDALAATGLADVGPEVEPLARVTATQELLLAADLPSRGEDDPEDYVAGYTPTSRLCDLLTPRPRVRAALDVGTGCGVQALLAAAHAERVVGADVNPRALAYAELNAGLNGVDNVEWRRGSFFEPVDGERFDLITCNAPFVVSPEARWAYRDTAQRGDELSAFLVREAAARLADGGFATLLVSWLAADPDDPDERVLDWVEETGCDAWVLPAYGADPLDHAAGWNDHLAGDSDAFATTLDAWTAYLDELGARWVSEGAVLLHRRPGRVSVRVDEIDEDELEDADRQIRRAFANRAAGLRGEGLLRARLELAKRVRVERVSKRDGGTDARIVMEEGTHPLVEVSGRLADALVQLGEKKPPRFEPEDERVLRELLELGILRLR